ncbi:PTS galactitol transporter subunit IIA [Polycladomyces abyssicola]|uniref:PTS galactitol transporter subunit IIA n=1 Tax=Polycladomyces abyssicola TaxID=1125966 RepID=A0A8D5ZKB5_9BACL|nr:PTS sugar transporter subunit IIA [Polycladomyces abyssicola]BCU81329.1 PTS galactitol transporter subunit IIA [Polycladomyces abyssicola]
MGTIFSDFFHRELIFTDVVYADREDLLEKISRYLWEKGFVKESFREAILERERKYPTGLRILPHHVAIPHIDPEHIKTPFIAMVRPKQSIEFIEMATHDQVIDARLVFVLGLKQSADQVELLQSLIELFMKQKVMDQLLKEHDVEVIMSSLEKNLSAKGLSV